MMSTNADLVREALDRLDEILRDPRYEKDGEAIHNAIERYYRRHPAELQAALKEALRIWIQSEDQVRVSHAIGLCLTLQLLENLPVLEQLLSDIRDGRSVLPKYFTQMLERTISKLYNIKKGS